MTNKLLVPGFFSAINSVVSNIFSSQLQRIVLDDKIIVLTGKEIIVDSKPKWILVSVTVDIQHNDKLVNSIIFQLMDIISTGIDTHSNKYSPNTNLDDRITNFIEKKIFLRSKKKIVLSSTLIFITFICMSFLYSFIRSFQDNIDKSNLVSFTLTIFFSTLIIPIACLVGSKKLSMIIGFIVSFIASISSYWLIEEILSVITFLGILGDSYVFITFYLLLGLTFGYLGGLIIERYRLIQ